MNVFIQKIKGRERVRIKHGDQIFTIDDYNGYNGDEVEWLKNCVERFFATYDESVNKSIEQPEAISGEKTKTETVQVFKNLTDAEKDKIIQDYVLMASRETLKVFMTADLKTHIESMIVNDFDGCKYVFSFKTLTRHLQDIQERVDQQTAFKDQKITELTNLLSDTNKRIQEIQDEEESKDKEIKELKEAISELIQVKDWKDKHGKDERYLKAMPIAWENARKLIQK